MSRTNLTADAFRQTFTHPVLGALVVVALTTGTVLTAGCEGTSGSPLAPTTSGGVSAEVLAAMNRGIIDEYRAETIYEGVIGDFGPTLPFSNIIFAEERHSTAIASLFTARGLAVPANTWTMTTVPHFATVTAACAAGVVAEQENIAMYDQFFTLDLPADVSRVFTNNRAASLVNHLPAFQVCD